MRGKNYNERPWVLVVFRNINRVSAKANTLFMVRVTGFEPKAAALRVRLVAMDLLEEAVGSRCVQKYK